MAVLPRILKDLRIKDLKDFNQYIHGNNNGPLRIIKNERLQSDFPYCEIKNNEIHSDFIEFNNSIFDSTQLSLYPKSGIVLKNCIFTGDISINGKDSNALITIEIENCIFLNELIVTGFPKNQNKKILIFHTNAGYFSMFNIKASEIILTGCKIFFLALHKIESVKFEVENNYFKHFEMESFKFEEVSFDHRQFDIKSMGKRILKNMGKSQFEIKIKMDINLFQFISYKTSSDIQKNESYNTMLETISFLKSSTSISSDRNKYTELMFFEVILAQDNPVHKAFVWLTGGFLKPFRFILIAITIFVLFSTCYALPMMKFNSTAGLSSSLSLEQILYFSGITFTTIGYGDITPVGISRLFAVLESVFGISTLSGFLVALVKKYID